MRVVSKIELNELIFDAHFLKELNKLKVTSSDVGFN
jgi:hypothetical protein